jgi:hypothetical protein
MKVKWSKPIEKKFYGNFNNNINNYNNISNSFYKNPFSSLPSLSSFNNNNPNNENNQREKNNDTNKEIIYLYDHILIFKETEVYIFKFIYNNNINKANNINNNNKDISLSSTSLSSPLPIFEIKDLILIEIKKINFISIYEKINFCLLNNDNKNILISTDFGSVNILSINFKDYYIELLHTFSIRQNYLYNFEILQFLDIKNTILITMDNQLFLCETHLNKTKGTKSTTQVYKNCLFKCEFLDEKILHAEKLENLVVIFSNKAIYLVDLYDISVDVFLKKDTKNNFSGKIHKENICFIKDENTYAIYNLKDREKKLSFKLSSKNQLKVLNFNKVIYIDDDFMVIKNNKNTEVYFISLVNYKVINRENILFEDPCFLICETNFDINFNDNDNNDKNNDNNDNDNYIKENYNEICNKKINKHKFLISFSLNLNSFDLKYKIAYTEFNDISEASKNQENNNNDAYEINNININNKNNNNKVFNNDNEFKCLKEYNFNENKEIKNPYGNINNNSNYIYNTDKNNNNNNLLNELNKNQVDNLFYINHKFFNFINFEVWGNLANFNRDRNIINENKNNNNNNALGNINSFDLKNLEDDFIKENDKENLKIFEIKKLKVFTLRELKHIKLFFSEDKFFYKKFFFLQIFYLMNYFSSFVSLKEINKTKIFIEKIENKIKLIWTNKYGSYLLLKILFLLNENYLRDIIRNKIFYLLRICELSNDKISFNEIFEKYKILLLSK